METPIKGQCCGKGRTANFSIPSERKLKSKDEEEKQQVLQQQ